MEIWYLYFFIVVVAEILAIWLLNEWSQNDKIYYIILGVLGYILVAVFFALLLRSISGDKLAIINGIWQVIGLIAITLIGVLFLKEKIHMYQWVGFGFAIISLIFLCIGEVVKD